MKRVLIGGFLSLIGSIWAMAVLFVAGSNLTSGWTTPPGRFMTTVAEMGLSEVLAGDPFRCSGDCDHDG